MIGQTNRQTKRYYNFIYTDIHITRHFKTREILLEYIIKCIFIEVVLYSGRLLYQYNEILFFSNYKFPSN